MAVARVNNNKPILIGGSYIWQGDGPGSVYNPGEPKIHVMPSGAGVVTGGIFDVLANRYTIRPTGWSH